MTDVQDPLDPDIRALLKKANETSSPQSLADEDRERLWSSLEETIGAEAIAGASTTATGIAGASTVLSGSAPWWIGLILVTGLGLGGLLFVSSEPSETEVVQPVSSIEEQVEEPVEEPIEELVEEPMEEPVEEPVEEPMEELLEEPRPTPIPPETSEGADVDERELVDDRIDEPGQREDFQNTLAAERELLSRAQSQLANSNVEVALEILNAHGEDYPGGVLSEERDALRIRALYLDDQSEEARNQAQVFRNNYPDSIFHDLIRAP